MCSRCNKLILNSLDLLLNLDFEHVTKKGKMAKPAAKHVQVVSSCLFAS